MALGHRIINVHARSGEGEVRLYLSDGNYVDVDPAALYRNVHRADFGREEFGYALLITSRDLSTWVDQVPVTFMERVRTLITSAFQELFDEGSVTMKEYLLTYDTVQRYADRRASSQGSAHKA